MQTVGNMKKIQMPKINVFLLFPPIDEAMSLLGFPENFYGWVNFISKENGGSLPVDPKTLRKVNKEGVSEKTFQKAMEPLMSFAGISSTVGISEEFSDAIFEKTNFTLSEEGFVSNGRFWNIFATAFSSQCSDLFPKMWRFIQKRAEAEQHAMSLYREGDNAGFLKVVSANILLEPHEIQSFYEDIWCGKNKKELFCEHQKFISKFLLDFYFWVIAYIELDTYEEYTDKVELTDEEEKLLKRGLFERIFRCNKEGKRQRFLTKLLDRWRDVYSRKILKQETIITRFEFSHRLPEAIYTEKLPGEMSLEERQDSKYRMFCHWAKGDKYPSDEKLKMFIENLLPPCQQRVVVFLCQDSNCYGSVF